MDPVLHSEQNLADHHVGFGLAGQAVPNGVYPELPDVPTNT
jgi:hypothetical protein